MRKIIFWIHLSVGVTLGLVILNLAVTGMILAFEPQVLAFLDRDVRTVAARSADTARVGAAALLASATAAHPKGRPTSITWAADPTSAVVVGLGRDIGAVYVDPYDGRVLGRETRAHALFHAVEGWHRRLSFADGENAPGRAATGAAAIALCGMIVSGLYIWCPPRPWTWRRLRAVAWPRRGLTARPRELNWHNVAGLWCAPLLLVIAVSGLVMSYRWASHLVYAAAGTPPPPERTVARTRERAAPPDVRALPLDAIATRAAAQTQGWRTITLRFPRRDGEPVTASILEAPQVHPAPRSSITFDAKTGALLKSEPFAEASRGRRWRALVRPLHTGEIGGLPGQVLAFVAAGSAAVLGVTGLAMAWRRLTSRRRRRAEDLAGAVTAS